MAFTNILSTNVMAPIQASVAAIAKLYFESCIERYLIANIKPLLQEHIAEYEITSAKVIDYDSRRAALLRKIDKLKDLYVNDIITMDELKKR